MNPQVTTLAKKIEELNEANRKAFDGEDAERAKDENFVMSAADREAVKDRNKQIEELDGQLASLTEMDGIRSETSARRTALRTPAAGGPAIHSPVPAGRKARTYGELFTSSKEWADVVGKWPNGIPDRARIHTDPVAVGTFLPARRAADIIELDDNGTGSFAGADRQADVARIPFMETGLFDVISRRTTNSDLVEYVRQTSRNNNAAAVPAATTGGTATDSDLNTSGVKPQSDFGLKVVQEPVKTIAHWAAATRKALADVGQLRGIIDDELLSGLRDVLVDQMINGDGTGENFKGLAELTNATDGITEQAFVTDLLVTTRKARTASMVTGMVRPNAYLMSPQTWEDIELSKDGQDRFYFASPQSLATPRLWGLPVVEDPHMPDDVIITGDLTQATLWDRQGAQIYVTDSHADFFIRNLIAILAEQRAAFGVRRPAAIVLITSTS